MAIDRLVRSVGDNSGVEIALRAYKLGAESLNGITAEVVGDFVSGSFAATFLVDKAERKDRMGFPPCLSGIPRTTAPVLIPM